MVGTGKLAAAALEFAQAGVKKIVVAGRDTERGERTRNSVAGPHPASGHPLLMSTAVLPYMRDRGVGRIAGPLAARIMRLAIR